MTKEGIFYIMNAELRDAKSTVVRLNELKDFAGDISPDFLHHLNKMIDYYEKAAITCDEILNFLPIA